MPNSNGCIDSHRPPTDLRRPFVEVGGTSLPILLSSPYHLPSRFREKKRRGKRSHRPADLEPIFWPERTMFLKNKIPVKHGPYRGGVKRGRRVGGLVGLTGGEHTCSHSSKEGQFFLAGYLRSAGKVGGSYRIYVACATPTLVPMASTSCLSSRVAFPYL